METGIRRSIGFKWMNFKIEVHRRQFEEMYETYQPSLRGIAYQYRIPKEETEDIIHDTFVAYARSEYPVELPETELKKLLFRIFRNRCIDYYRRLKRRGCYSIEEEWFRAQETLMEERTVSVLEEIVSNEKCRAILNEIAHMPDNWREVAKLKMLEGRSTEDVCRILNISEKACYSRVGRIRKYIDSLLRNENWP